MRNSFVAVFNYLSLLTLMKHNCSLLVNRYNF